MKYDGAINLRVNHFAKPIATIWLREYSPLWNKSKAAY